MRLTTNVDVIGVISGSGQKPDVFAALLAGANATVFRHVSPPCKCGSICRVLAPKLFHLAVKTPGGEIRSAVRGKGSEGGFEDRSGAEPQKRSPTVTIGPNFRYSAAIAPTS